MKSDRLENWLKNIYDTKDAEISCTECFDSVSHFVEVELSGDDAAIKMPQVKQHLGQCRACRDEYEALREIRQLENDGQFPSVDDLQNSIQ